MPHGRKPLNVAYATYMRNHPFGTALYIPLAVREFHPGSCGYFDAGGSWNPITDLADSERLAHQGYDSVSEELEKAPAETNIQWGPLASENIIGRSIDFSGGLSAELAAVLPANLSAELAFENSSSGGALLVTAPPIAHERFYHESLFKKWVIQNAGKLVRQRSEIFEYGLCVVTKTWATEDCAIHLWDETAKEVKVGFDVGVDAIGQLGPGFGWSVDKKDGGWMRYRAGENDRGLVVFFDGIRFKSRKIRIRGEVLKPESRTYSETIGLPIRETIATVPVPDDEDSIYAIDCEPF